MFAPSGPKTKATTLMSFEGGKELWFVGGWQSSHPHQGYFVVPPYSGGTTNEQIYETHLGATFNSSSGMEDTCCFYPEVILRRMLGKAHVRGRWEDASAFYRNSGCFPMLLHVSPRVIYLFVCLACDGCTQLALPCKFFCDTVGDSHCVEWQIDFGFWVCVGLWPRFLCCCFAVVFRGETQIWLWDLRVVWLSVFSGFVFLVDLPNNFNETTVFHAEFLISLICLYQFQDRALERYRPYQRKQKNRPFFCPSPLPSRVYGTWV